jgi:hypothetical protein
MNVAANRSLANIRRKSLFFVKNARLARIRAQNARAREAGLADLPKAASSDPQACLCTKSRSGE